MTTRLVDARWSQEIDEAVRVDSSELRIISPFIKDGALARLLAAGCGAVRELDIGRSELLSVRAKNAMVPP